MKIEIPGGNSAPQRHAERLNPAIEILVIDGVFIMPNAGRWVCHFIANEGNAVSARNWFELIDGRSRPGIDGGLRSHSGASRRKSEGAGSARNRELAIRNIIVHVALRGMRLTPGVLVRSDVLSFGKISCPGVQRRIQVAH